MELAIKDITQDTLDIRQSLVNISIAVKSCPIGCQKIFVHHFVLIAFAIIADNLPWFEVGMIYFPHASDHIMDSKVGMTPVVITLGGLFVKITSTRVSEVFAILIGF